MPRQNADPLPFRRPPFTQAPALAQLPSLRAKQCEFNRRIVPSPCRGKQLSMIRPVPRSNARENRTEAHQRLTLPPNLIQNPRYPRRGISGAPAGRRCASPRRDRHRRGNPWRRRPGGDLGVLARAAAEYPAFAGVAAQHKSHPLRALERLVDDRKLIAPHFIRRLDTQFPAAVCLPSNSMYPRARSRCKGFGSGSSPGSRCGSSTTRLNAANAAGENNCRS